MIFKGLIERLSVLVPYIVRRILVFIPTLIAISFLSFLISVNAPGDPVELLATALGQDGAAQENQTGNNSIKNKIRRDLGLDKPIFYFGLGTVADCDTLYKVADKGEQKAIKSLSRKVGYSENVISFHKALKIEKGRLNTSVDSSLSAEEKALKSEAIFQINSLLTTSDLDVLSKKITKLDSIKVKLPLLDAVEYKKTYENMIISSSPWRGWLPSISFYGFNNQYHSWLFGDWLQSDSNGRKGVIRGDFGFSFQDGKPVGEIIWSKFKVTFVLIFFSVLLSYLVSIPIGIYSAYKKDGAFDKTSTILLFIMYSLPSYFVGTVLLYTFSSPDMLWWFPESGLFDPQVNINELSFWERIEHQAPYHVLPLITYTYSSFAFLSRIMRIGVTEVLEQDYIRTARAKGLSEKTVVLKHALRNSLIPIITVFANVFPAAVGGSVIIETIFSIDGMGKASFEAITLYDYPMILGIFTIAGALTVVGYLFADIMYTIVDPRISLKR